MIISGIHMYLMLTNREMIWINQSCWDLNGKGRPEYLMYYYSKEENQSAPSSSSQNKMPESIEKEKYVTEFRPLSVLNITQLLDEFGVKETTKYVSDLPDNNYTEISMLDAPIEIELSKEDADTICNTITSLSYNISDSGVRYVNYNKLIAMIFLLEKLGKKKIAKEWLEKYRLLNESMEKKLSNEVDNWFNWNRSSDNNYTQRGDIVSSMYNRGELMHVRNAIAAIEKYKKNISENNHLIEFHFESCMS